MIEADELWRFVGSKANVQWGWVALDARTRRVPAVGGGRSEFTAWCLWYSVPDAVRDAAVFRTAFRRRRVRLGGRRAGVHPLR